MPEHELVQFAKGAIGPEDIRVDGTLRPEAASRLISMIVEDPFLKLITTERMGKLKKDVDVFDIASRQLVRVAEGTEPTSGELASIDEYGCTLDAKDVQLYVDIKKSFILDNQDNPQLSSQLESAFSTKLGNELVDLGFNGNLDDNSDGFLTLNVGWFALADEDPDATQVDIDLVGNTMVDTLQSLLDEQDSRYRQDSAFLMSTANADKYAKEVASTEGIRIDDERASRYLKYPIIGNRHCPEDQIMFTPLKNLVFGIVKDIERSREYSSRKRAVEYTWVVWCDYEIAVKAAAILGRPAPA